MQVLAAGGRGPKLLLHDQLSPTWRGKASLPCAPRAAARKVCAPAAAPWPQRVRRAPGRRPPSLLHALATEVAIEATRGDPPRTLAGVPPSHQTPRAPVHRPARCRAPLIFSGARKMAHGSILFLLAAPTHASLPPARTRTARLSNSHRRGGGRSKWVGWARAVRSPTSACVFTGQPSLKQGCVHAPPCGPVTGADVSQPV